MLLWCIVATILVLYYGRGNANYVEAFYFVTMLMPVAVGTAYFFNYYLVPNYLLARKYWTFALYMFYMVVITLYLEMLALVFSFVFLYNYQYGEMNPLTVDTFSVFTTIYLIVFTFAFFRMIEFYRRSDSEKRSLIEKIELEKQKILTVISDRKQVPILIDEISYLESLANYVRIDHEKGKTITKEKISALEAQLPSHFVRVHRSFIVNKHRISSFNSEHVTVGEDNIPISRTFKKKTLGELEG